MFLYGASGHGKVIFNILQLNGISVTAFIDDDADKKVFFGLPVYQPHTLDSTNILQAIISVGNNSLRKQIAEKYFFQYHSAVHPSAIIDENVKMGLGSVMMANAVVNSSSSIGKHCIINTSASVDHDCYVGDFVHISPNVCLCGGVSVGEGTHIGAGSVIIPGV